MLSVKISDFVSHAANIFHGEVINLRDVITLMGETVSKITLNSPIGGLAM
jgi:predicted HicB family RNase H-like nuclease